MAVHPDSLIFDLDGTLWNSCFAIAEGWNIALKNCDIQRQLTPQEIESICGLQYMDCCKKLLPDLTTERILEIRPELEKQEEAALRIYGGQLYPFVLEHLQLLSNKYKLYIVSNCQDWYLELFLEKFSLKSLMTDCESYGRTGKGKAHNIKLVIERNHCSNPVYIGDTLWDREASQSAGIPFIYAQYGFGKFEHSPFITKITELNADFLSAIQ